MRRPIMEGATSNIFSAKMVANMGIMKGFEVTENIHSTSYKSGASSSIEFFHQKKRTQSWLVARGDSWYFLRFAFKASAEPQFLVRSTHKLTFVVDQSVTGWTP